MNRPASPEPPDLPGGSLTVAGAFGNEVDPPPLLDGGGNR